MPNGNCPAGDGLLNFSINLLQILRGGSTFLTLLGGMNSLSRWSIVKYCCDFDDFERGIAASVFPNYFLISSSKDRNAMLLLCHGLILAIINEVCVISRPV
jgi:hypothetical protein